MSACSPGARSRSRSQGEQSIETVPGSPYSMEAQERLRQALLRSSSGSSSRQAGSSGTTLPASRSASSQPAAVVNCVKISELTAQEKKQFIETGWVVRDNTAWEVQPESDTEDQVTQTEELLENPYQVTQRNPDALMRTWREHRRQHPELFQKGVRAWSQTASTMDETICGLLTQTDSDQNTMASE